MPVSLSVERVIHAARDIVFAAWTNAATVKLWWGPRRTTCPEAEVDSRDGGAYRIANRAANGAITWTSGRFGRARPPEELAYTWATGSLQEETTLVRIAFFALGGAPADLLRRALAKFPNDPKVKELSAKAAPSATRIEVTHEHFADEAARDIQVAWWLGSLDKLERLCAPEASAPGLSAEARSCLKRGDRVAAELEAVRPGYRGFVTVCPFKEASEREPAYAGLPWRYRIRRYELHNDLMFAEIFMGLLKDFEEATADALPALEAQLAGWAPGAAFHSNREVLAPY